MERLYVVIRSDLPAGAIASQACHAVSEFATLFPELHGLWHRGEKNIVLLSIAGETELVALRMRIAEHAIPCVSVQEPDLGWASTAIAFHGQGSKLVSSLPLALREPRAA